LANGYWHHTVVSPSVFPSVRDAVYYGAQGRKLCRRVPWTAFPIHFAVQESTAVVDS